LPFRAFISALLELPSTQPGQQSMSVGLHFLGFIPQCLPLLLNLVINRLDCAFLFQSCVQYYII
jgi:hypothetical protein